MSPEQPFDVGSLPETPLVRTGTVAARSVPSSRRSGSRSSPAGELRPPRGRPWVETIEPPVGFAGADQLASTERLDLFFRPFIIRVIVPLDPNREVEEFLQRWSEVSRGQAVEVLERQPFATCGDVLVHAAGSDEANRRQGDFTDAFVVDPLLVHLHDPSSGGHFLCS